MADNNSAHRAEVSFETKRSRRVDAQCQGVRLIKKKGRNAISLSDKFNDHHDAKILISDVPLFDVLLIFIKLFESCSKQRRGRRLELYRFS